MSRQLLNESTSAQGVLADGLKDIGEAYEVLCDVKRRSRYDELTGSATSDVRVDKPAINGCTGFSEFFERYFWPYLKEHKHPRSGPGDMSAQVLLSLHEAAHGTVRNLSVIEPETGADRNIRVELPRGVNDGDAIRVNGCFDRSSSGGQSGNLFATVHFAIDPIYEVQGSDLSYQLDLAPWEAVLGGSFRIPTLNSADEIMIEISSGTQAGKTFRMRGKGFPTKSNGNGDL